MRILQVALLVIATTTFTPVASAQNKGLNGRVLLQNCTSAVNTDTLSSSDINGLAGASHCLALIQGISFVMDDNNTRVAPMRVCLPDGVNNSQLALIVKKFLEDNPTKLHFPDTALVAVALTEAFPCK